MAELHWHKQFREFWQDVDLDDWANSLPRPKTPASGCLFIVGTLSQVNGRIVLRDTEGVQYELQDRGPTAMDLAFDIHHLRHDTHAHVPVLWDGSSFRLSPLT
jgi:hypothetical protein